ncbi:MAG: M1 family metallopeptidase [Acidimicrobiia bacterium]
MKRVAVLVLVGLFAASCTGDAEPDTTDAAVVASSPSAPTTTTTTTTTTLPTFVAGASGIGDDYYPSLGNGGYDVEHYHLDLTYSDDGTVDASAAITATAIDNLESFNLDFAGWQIERLEVNGEVSGFERNGEEMTITSVGLLSGDVFEVEIDYSGTPEPTTSSAIPFGIGWHTGPEGEQYVAAEPDAAHSWFPSNDHPLDKSTFTFAVTVPSRLSVAANGELVDVDEGDTTTTYHWSMADPMAPYLATIVIGDGWALVDDPVSTEAAGIPVSNFLPPDLAANPPAPLEATGEMIRVLERAFGPYPFDRYGIAVVGGFPAALENQTLSVFGRTMVESPYFEYVLVHELAHQWFGDSVSVGEWSDIWLNEGFATYAELLWVEELYGPGAYREEVANRIQAAEIAGYGPPGTPAPDDLFNGSVYQRGSFVLVALRDEVGDDVFFETLRTYAEQFSDGNATTEDFVSLAEEIADRDLGDLFSTWLYDEQIPA